MDIPYYTAKTISPWDPANPPLPDPDPARPYTVRTTLSVNGRTGDGSETWGQVIGDVLQSEYPIWHGQYDIEYVSWVGGPATMAYIGIYVKNEWGLKSTMSLDHWRTNRYGMYDILQMKQLVSLQNPRAYQGSGKYTPGVALRDDLTVPVRSEVLSMRGNQYIEYIDWNYGVYFKENDEFVEDPEYLGSTRRRYRYYYNHFNNKGEFIVDEEAHQYWHPGFFRYHSDYTGGGYEDGEYIIRDINNPTFATGAEWLVWCKSH